MYENDKVQKVGFPAYWVLISGLIYSAGYIVVIGIIVSFLLFLNGLSSNLLFAFIFLPMGVAFLLNGFVLRGSIGQKNVGLVDIVVAAFILFPALILYLSGFTVILGIIGALSLLYFMFGGVFISKYDAKGLGWYCLFAMVVFIWYGYSLYAMGPAGMYFGLFCWAWALLALLCWIAFSLGKALTPAIAWLFIIESILTLLIPGILLLMGNLNPIINQ